VTSNGITGALGGRWRADVTPWGALEPWDGSPTLDWHVAADDRWHSPATESTVRQHRVEGTPVFETRLRVPSGDAVHRCYSVAAAGGATVIELTNDSALPIAVALTRPDLLTSRPPTDVPIEGIALPTGTIVVPIGHRASVTVALAHGGTGPAPLPRGLAPAAAVAGGWRSIVERASRLELPDAGLVDAVIAARCDLLLAGPPASDGDPAGFLLACGELVRLDELSPTAASSLTGEVADAVEIVASRPGWDVEGALDAAGLLLARAGDRRAVRDIVAISGARERAPLPVDAPGGIRNVAWVERRFADGATLFPQGMPTGWRGAGLEAHGLAIGPATRLSFAVRWHGERPALLWEQDGDPLALHAPAIDPSWASAAPRGETLWPAPAVSISTGGT